MLAKGNRLFKETDFKRLALKGRSIFGPLFNVKVLPNSEEESRFGIVISAKVSKKAVIRNLYKRRITEAIRLRLPDIKVGADVMIVVKKDIIDKDYSEVVKELEKSFFKARLYI